MRARLRLAVVTVTAALLAGTGLARADDGPTPGRTDDHYQWSFVPVAGGDSDIGFGIGQVSSIARVWRGTEPYVWNLESAGLITFKFREHVVVPVQDLFFKITVPHLIRDRMRLEVRPAYTWESTLHYFGVGNASTVNIPAGRGDLGAPDAQREYFEFGRVHPSLAAMTRWTMARHLYVLVGASYTHNWFQIGDGSRLAEDMRAGSPEVKKLLGTASTHAVQLFEYGVQLDTRDSEIAPHSGTFHQMKLRFSPGSNGSDLFPYAYGSFNFTGRFYVPIYRHALTLAVRYVGDALAGNPPFYELARFEDTYALGGANGVRGIPAQRYQGKIKAFGNIELRTELVSFRAFDKQNVFGIVAFFDGGRVWSDWSHHPELDGTGIGIKYGVGGGLRLQSGDAFVLRTDVAWSPDARPIGAYFSAGQIF